MKPLSPVNYYKNNKKSFITSIIAISLSVIMVYGIDCFLQSMDRTNYDSQIKRYEKMIKITAVSQGNVIDDEILKKIKENKNIEKIVPAKTLGISYTTVGSFTEIPIYGLLKNDREFVMSKYRISLEEGRLPEEGKKEVVLDTKVALNHKLKVGELWEDYKVVGLIKSDYFISFSSFFISSEEAESTVKNLDVVREKLMHGYALVFPKDGSYDKAYELFSSFSKDDMNYLALQDVQEEYDRINKTTNQIFDAIIILIIIVNVVTLACSKYTQFVNRKSEYGILNSLGYSRQEIMKMSLYEVIFLNFTAFFIGILLAVVITYLLTKGAFESIGGIMVFISVKGFMLSMLTPLFAALFTLIPIFRKLGNMDGISIIEEV